MTGTLLELRAVCLPGQRLRLALPFDNGWRPMKPKVLL
jgi:hypothetical protein